MTRAPIRFVLLGVVLATAFAAGIGALAIRRAVAGPPGEAGAFVRAVNLSPLDRAAVWHEGRLKSFDAFATEILGHVSGRRPPLGLPADFALLDMILRPDRYESAPIIFVKHKEMRAHLAETLVAAGAMTEEQAREARRRGLFAEPMLAQPKSEELLRRWSMDAVRTAKHVDAVQSARALRRPEVLLDLLAMIPPPSGRADRPWLSLGVLWPRGAMLQPGDSPHAGIAPAMHAELRRVLTTLASSWRAQDASAASSAVAELASLLPRVAPAVYPETTRMVLQSWYFKARNMTWVWTVYLAAVVLLLMAVVYRWERARAIGVGFFAVAFALHTAALLWRWYVAGRWPNSNMFEAVTTSVWLGTIAVIGFEVAARRTPMRNLFMLGGSAASMCALMAAAFVPQLSGTINNMMPILHDLWLYIHTNVIIASYALIAMAAVTALLYLVRRALGGDAGYARVGGAGSIVNMGGPLVRRGGSASLSEVLDGATMVLMELAFILLWAGIIMGAIWADHSWGRPWGWDPKEVFALNTFLVFLILVHVRLKARDKGLWTAVLAVVGCGVMLFNWIVINFIISGLHSYA